MLTHRPPKKLPRQAGGVTFTFVTEGIESAVEQTKADAGGKDVTIIGGASTAQQCRRAGLADELHIDVMPLLFGGGLRLFDHIDAEEVRLERIKAMELPGGRTHLKFRLVR